MLISQYQKWKVIAILSGSVALLGCGAQPGTTNVNLANASTNANTVAANTATANVNSANTAASSTTVSETKEPEQYQAKVTLKIETVGTAQNRAIPTLAANVARNATDRRMEFTMPAGGRVVFLDKGGKNYLILPEKNQYAELTKESLGFDIRRMLMPENIVEQVKTVRGVERVGEEKYNGRDAIKYRYAAVANTQSRAGEVATESFLIVDKATGLPLRSETVTQSQSGGNVQGYSGVRIVTEITDIKSEVSPDLFAEPTSMQKIESDQVRSSVDMIFNSIAALIRQMIKPPPPPEAPAR